MSGLLSAHLSLLLTALHVLLFAGISVSQVSILSRDSFPLACSFSYTPFAKLAVEAKLSFQILNFFLFCFFICKGHTVLQVKEGASAVKVV